MKKYGLAVFGSILAVLLTSCGAALSGDGKENIDEKMEITVAFWDVDEAFVGDEVLSSVEERFQIRLKPVQMVWDDYKQKIERWAATGSLPDLFIGDFRNSPLGLQWVEQGLLQEIPEELSKYPNLENYLKQVMESGEATIGGKLYCIPRQTYPSQEWTSIDRIIAYRWDLAKAAGITKEPENWEEFQEMILAIIEADPEGKNIEGMTSTGAGRIAGIILPYSSCLAAAEGTVFHWIRCEDGIYRPAYFAEDLTKAFQLGRDMYTSGVIEKDVVLQTSQSAEEKFLTGKNAAIQYDGGFGGEYSKMSSLWKEYHENDYTEDVKALRLMPDQNGNKTYPVWGYAWSESYINANVGQEKLDKILQLYDYLLSDEGAFFTSYGPEGELYEIVDGKVQMYDDGAIVSDKYPSCGVLGILVRWNPSSYDDRFAAGIPETYNQVNYDLAREAKAVKIPDHENECIQIMREKKIDFGIKNESDFLRIMTGTEPVEEMWEEIYEEYEEKGLQKVIDTVNEEMQRREK